jgi:small membrane protein
MSIVKIILLLLPVFFAYVAFIRTKQTHVKAYQKILFLGFIIFTVFAFISPESITKLAEDSGFQRGSYLLIYVIVVAIVFSTIAIYLKFNEMSHKIVDLAREITLLEADIQALKKKK